MTRCLCSTCSSCRNCPTLSGNTSLRKPFSTDTPLCWVGHMHACTHARMHTCTHARMHTCTHAHMHACTHAHSTHTQMYIDIPKGTHHHHTAYGVNEDLMMMAKTLPSLQRVLSRIEVFDLEKIHAKVPLNMHD